MGKFFDFCAGIGGGRLGLERNGLQCIGHSEIDAYTAQVYAKFFDDEHNFGDLTLIDPKTLPDFDFMIAGFPCQTFSIVGKRQGFADHRGQIIYALINILQVKKVKYFILENVKGLINHNKGETFKTIQQELKQAGYDIYFRVLDSINFGVPHMRERIYIVGFQSELNITQFEFPQGRDEKTCFTDFLDDENHNELSLDNPTFLKYLSNKYNQNQYSVNDILQWEDYSVDWRQSDLRKYKHCFPTLRTGRHGLLYVRNGKLKKLNAYEGLLLQGFPKQIAEKVKQDKFYINNKVLSQAGNAMTVNVIEDIAKLMLRVIAND